jgi:UPF0716 family protein affecting phage T7 exclusion
LILVGGTLMLSPGFVTDAFGILLILPFTRPVARRVLTRIVSRRLIVHEGRRAWQALNSALSSGHMPARELADGALILVGGTLIKATCKDLGELAVGRRVSLIAPEEHLHRFDVETGLRLGS